MSQVTINLPDALQAQLEQQAASEQKSLEEVVLERLGALPAVEPDPLKERYEEFVRTSGLFREVSEEEKRRYQALPEDALREIAARLGKGRPASEMIIEDRGEW